MRNELAAVVCLAGLAAGNGWAEKPKILRERTEWLNIWINDATRNDLPRVLLIGDSITAGYFPGVTDALKGKAYVARLGTSKALGDPALFDEIKMVLSQYQFAVIHFNVGLHGWDYTENDYRKQFPLLLKVLKKSAPKAKLIWATTTPRRVGPPDFKSFHEGNDRVKERNRIAAEFTGREDIPTNDLYGLAEDHPEYMSDGVHFNREVWPLQVKQVLRYVLEALGP